MKNLTLTAPPEEFILANEKAEQSLLGSILVSNDAVLLIPSWFKPEHFYITVHQELYAKIREFYASGKVANPITLKPFFLDSSYLMALARGAAIIHVPDYCDTIYAEWLKREAYSLCQSTLAELSSPETRPPEEVINNLVSSLGAAVDSAITAKVRTNVEVGNSIVEGFKVKKNQAYKTGLQKLDDAMQGGLYPSKLYAFAARKKVGKTSMAVTLSHNLSKEDVKHAFLCFEMSSEEIDQRVLAREMGCYMSDFRYKSDDMKFQIRAAEAVIKRKKNVLYHDAPGMGFDELKQVFAMYAMRHKVKGIIIDYWQIIGGKQKNKSMSEHLDEIAQWLASACRKYGVWCVIMAQINQEGNTRGSEGIRLAADQVYEIHREDLSSPCAWVEMLETRYTAWNNIGDENNHGLEMNKHGQYFEQVESA